MKKPIFQGWIKNKITLGVATIQYTGTRYTADSTSRKNRFWPKCKVTSTWIGRTNEVIEEEGRIWIPEFGNLRIAITSCRICLGTIWNRLYIIISSFIVNPMTHCIREQTNNQTIRGGWGKTPMRGKMPMDNISQVSYYWSLFCVTLASAFFVDTSYSLTVDFVSIYKLHQKF